MDGVSTLTPYPLSIMLTQTMCHRVIPLLCSKTGLSDFGERRVFCFWTADLGLHLLSTASPTNE